jgi:nicotinamide mononucleotide transporter
MPDLLSVNTIAFSILDYPMSYIELVGTVLYLASVWLIARKNMLTWPVGIVSVLLYMALFYQIRLYSDAVEQVYYLGASAYGWWYWRHASSKETVDDNRDFRISRPRTIGMVVGFTVLASLLVGLLMTRVHLLLPGLFPEAASFPYLDVLTTIMSLTAMWLMAQKRIESWIYWIIVDVIGIWLYFVKDVRFISLLYVILLVMAVNGLISWIRALNTAPSTVSHQP